MGTLTKTNSTEKNSISSPNGWTEISNSENNTSPPLLVIPSVIHLRILPVQPSTFLSSFPPLLPSFSVTILLTTTSLETHQSQLLLQLKFLRDATPLVTIQTPLIMSRNNASSG